MSEAPLYQNDRSISQLPWKSQILPQKPTPGVADDGEEQSKLQNAGPAPMQGRGAQEGKGGGIYTSQPRREEKKANRFGINTVNVRHRFAIFTKPTDAQLCLTRVGRLLSN